MTPTLAHAGHWAVQVAYFLPVVVFLAWLGWTTVKQRRGGSKDGGGASEAAGDEVARVSDAEEGGGR